MMEYFIFYRGDDYKPPGRHGRFNTLREARLELDKRSSSNNEYRILKVSDGYREIVYSRPHPEYIYRILKDTEDPMKGLTPRSPNSSIKVVQHVNNHQQSPFISCSGEGGDMLYKAENYKRKKNVPTEKIQQHRITKINLFALLWDYPDTEMHDLRKADIRDVDIPNPGTRGPKYNAHKWAVEEQEILIKGPIPRDVLEEILYTMPGVENCQLPVYNPPEPSTPISVNPGIAIRRFTETVQTGKYVDFGWIMPGSKQDDCETWTIPNISSDYTAGQFIRCTVPVHKILDEPPKGFLVFGVITRDELHAIYRDKYDYSISEMMPSDLQYERFNTLREARLVLDEEDSFSDREYRILKIRSDGYKEIVYSRPHPHFIYRILNDTEDPMKGLTPRSPNSSITVVQHVNNQQQSPFISCSGEGGDMLYKAVNYKRRKNVPTEKIQQHRIAKINLSALLRDYPDTEMHDLRKADIRDVDIPNPGTRDPKYNAHKWAVEEQEILIKGPIPRDVLEEILYKMPDVENCHSPLYNPPGPSKPISDNPGIAIRQFTEDGQTGRYVAFGWIMPGSMQDDCETWTIPNISSDYTAGQFIRCTVPVHKILDEPPKGFLVFGVITSDELHAIYRDEYYYSILEMMPSDLQNRRFNKLREARLVLDEEDSSSDREYRILKVRSDGYREIVYSTPHPHFIYRILNDTEDPMKGLTPRSPNSSITVVQYVNNQQQSPFISCSGEGGDMLYKAVNYKRKKNVPKEEIQQHRITKINLSALLRDYPDIEMHDLRKADIRDVDIPEAIGYKHNAHKWAVEAQEILIKGPIPRDVLEEILYTMPENVYNPPGPSKPISVNPGIAIRQFTEDGQTGRYVAFGWIMPESMQGGCETWTIPNISSDYTAGQFVRCTVPVHKMLEEPPKGFLVFGVITSDELHAIYRD